MSYLSPLAASLPVLGAVLAAMFVMWLFSLRLRDASIVDRYWGAGFVLAGWLYLLAAESLTVRSWLVVGLVTLWGLRLSIHISVRNHGAGEDYRYRKMRESHGPRFWWISLFTIFLLQGVILWIVSFPLWQAIRSSTPEHLGPVDILGIAVFFAGLLFEALGDRQLARFKADPANRGKLLTTGLWRYTRHPNYFGDALIWWGLTLIALATPRALWILPGPILMTWLLMKVSGVALLEEEMRKRKPGFAEYADTTNAFFPWFPRRNPGN